MRGHARTLALALVLASTAGMAAACTGRETPAGETGGTFIVAMPVAPTTLLPPTENTTQGMAIYAQLFDRLAQIGFDLNTVGDSGFTPQLASGWQWSRDSLSIAFTIDSAARWHDGAPVIAEDVRHTFRVYTSPDTRSTGRSLLGNIDSVSAPDARTAIFWFKRRTPQQFFDATYHMYVLPSHLLAQVADSALGASDFARRPVGTGRFRFARWDAGERIELVADTMNWRGRALLDRVIFSITTDAGAATVRLFSGEVDMFEQIKPENFAQLANAPDLRLLANPSLQYNFVGFNLRDRTDTTRPHPVFGDVAVRRALLLATDRERITRSIFDTLAALSIGPAPRALFPDTTLFTRPSMNLERARALLDSAGWVDSNNDGVRDRNGVRLAFEILSPATSMPRQRAAVQLQEQYRTLGVAVSLQSLETSQIVARFGTGDFDAWMGGWAATPGLRGIPGAWSTGGAQNVQRWSNRAFDAAIDTALSTFDRRRSAGAFARAFAIAWDDPPAVWLFEPQNPIGIHRRIVTTPIRADGWYHGLADWSVEPSQRIDRDRIGLGGGTPR